MRLTPSSEIRSLFLNLKDKGNPGLRNKIVLGDVSPDKVVTMSKEVSCVLLPLFSSGL